jgi:glyoxylase-like metal-dependent hydrolase (beta-lactamase superfamily II)
MRNIIVLFISIFSCAPIFGQTKEANLKIFPLTGGFYVYVTYNTVDGVRFPSNSMYLVTEEGVVLFDTPWDSTQFQPLLDSIRARHGKNVILSISTHFHADRTAGVEYLKERGVKTYSSKMTYTLCTERNERRPEYFFKNDTTFNVGGYKFATYYPGEGHTMDNIVIWFERDKILWDKGIRGIRV